MNAVSVCSICKSTMKPLFTGFFCPNDCDRRPDARPVVGVDGALYVVILGGVGWRFSYRRVLAGEPHPPWAKYDWKLYGNGLEDPKKADVQLVSGLVRYFKDIPRYWANDITPTSPTNVLRMVFSESEKV